MPANQQTSSQRDVLDTLPHCYLQLSYAVALLPGMPPDNLARPVDDSINMGDLAPAGRSRSPIL